MPRKIELSIFKPDFVKVDEYLVSFKENDSITSKVVNIANIVGILGNDETVFQGMEAEKTAFIEWLQSD